MSSSIMCEVGVKVHFVFYYMDVQMALVPFHQYTLIVPTAVSCSIRQAAV